MTQNWGEDEESGSKEKQPSASTSNGKRNNLREALDDFELYHFAVFELFFAAGKKHIPPAGYSPAI